MYSIFLKRRCKEGNRGEKIILKLTCSVYYVLKVEVRLYVRFQYMSCNGLNEIVKIEHGWCQKELCDSLGYIFDIRLCKPLLINQTNTERHDMTCMVMTIDELSDAKEVFKVKIENDLFNQETLLSY